ncbi:hypothetical protein GGR92_005251 [Spirosoma lacussanchae]|uniref:hypothetical protein n=1 Tax=Spirosoma lacussanchae TaxID=1884249 RepID=UPI0011095BF6|nr:hypothetical protein [Spirosoma lacussanchae]
MPKSLTTYGNITGGKLSIVEREKFYQSLSAFADCEISLTVKALEPQRSNSQNRYYHGIVVKMIAEAMSEAYGEDVDVDEAHEHLKSMFNLRTIETANGYTVKMPGSTKRLSTVEFSTYVDKCRMWAAEFFGINIPDPVQISTTKDSLRV